MRIFTSAKELYEETLRELFKRGQTVFDKTVQGKVVGEKEYEQKEIISYSYMLTDFKDLNKMMELAKKTFKKEHLTVKIAKVWFEDMLKNRSLKENWWDETPYTKEYFDKFCNEGGSKNRFASYSYGERIIPQLQGLIDRLKKNLYSRGAVISLFFLDDVWRIGRRTPCTLNYHFIVRKTIEGDKMNLIITQRSCDFVNFFPLDLYKAYLFLEYIADELDVKIGYIIHNIGSLHVYRLDIPLNYTW